MALPIDGMAFDVGNTLILDPFEKVLDRKSLEMRQVLSRFGYNFTVKEIKDAWTEANRKVNYAFICHFYQEAPVVSHCLEILKVEKAKRPEISTELLIVYRNGLKSVIMADDRLTSMKRVLYELRKAGKRLVVFGNGRQKSIELFLQWTGLREYFHFVSTSEKTGIEKPDHKAFNYILKTLATRKERSMYIGDDMNNDISPAKEAGMKACLYVPLHRVSTPWRNYDAKSRTRPDATISKFDELLQIVK